MKTQFVVNKKTTKHSWLNAEDNMLTKTLIYKKDAESLSFDANEGWTYKDIPTLTVTITSSDGEMAIVVPFETIKKMVEEFEVD